MLVELHLSNVTCLADADCFTTPCHGLVFEEKYVLRKDENGTLIDVEYHTR